MSALEQHLVAFLSRNPGLSAREIAAHLRGHGLQVNKRDLNPMLYRDARFENDDGRVPRWRLAGTGTATAVFSKTERGAAKRARRDELDRRQDAVASLVKGDARSTDWAESSDPALLEALALLRSRGITVDLPGVTTAAVPAPGALGPSTASSARGATPRRTKRAEPSVEPSTAPTSRTPQPPLEVPSFVLPLRPWQKEALTRWYQAGGSGVCEAVTGTGKTHLGLEAVAQVIRLGQRATVLVPSVLLQRQWEQQMQRHVPAAVIAKVGGVTRGDPRQADVVIAIVNSATTVDLTCLGSSMSLLVADEVHRYGGTAWSGALRDSYTYRLGLTATLERGSDAGVAEVLIPYFGGIVHKYGFDRAARERVVAPFDLVFLGVRLDQEEQALYETLSRKIRQARKVLIAAGGDPRKLDQQLGLLRSIGGDVTRAVIAYESSTRERRRLLAETGAKHSALESLTEVVGESRGTVIFTQSKETADVAASILQAGGLRAAAIYSEGMTPARRQSLIDALEDEQLDALAAPKILDEGVDVPDLDLGIVMGASNARRQMIQRLGRVVRLKRDGRRARFVILYVVGSVEDPESGSRDDFMSEVEEAANSVSVLPDWDEDCIDSIWSGISTGGGTARSAGRSPDPIAPTQPVAGATLAGRLAQSIEAEPGRIVAKPRVSRVRPASRRPHYPDPVVVADVLGDIEETRSLVEWVRDQTSLEKAG